MIKSKTFFKFLILTLVALLLGFSVVACADKGKETDFDVRFEVPETIYLEADEMEISFRIMFSKAPESSDQVVFENIAGDSKVCGILKVSAKNFTVSLADGFESGSYKVYIQRSSTRKLMGETTIYFNDLVGIKDESTVYGIVACGSTRLKDVVVSDGVEVVRTDENGIYQFKSEKKNGYVFVSVPSGYETVSDGILPKMHQLLKQSADVAERVDFNLVESGDQTSHTMLVFGDIHLANRTNDAVQFRAFINDVNDWIAANPGKKVYGLTLGDMTWDIYWVNNKADLNYYLEAANGIKNLQIYHTIGNHDHSCYLSGDFGSAGPYRETVGPTYYSFNIGNVHYVVLDDIVADNTGNVNDPSSGRNHSASLANDNIEWLKKDLAFVPKTTPIVVTMHAPLYNDNSSNTVSVKNGSALVNVLKPYSEVHVVTAHTHKMYNADKLSVDHIYEHNSGAVCATWWWTGKNYPGIHIGQDGTPGGYRIMDVKGNDFKWVYKPTGASTQMQFRTYDGNSIDLSYEKAIPNASDAGKVVYALYASEWMTKKSDNYVYINVWDYDPSWTVSVTENGKSLNVERMSGCHDPLHVLTYTAKSIDGGSTSPTFPTSSNRHTFRVKASDATSTLNIVVKDRFGNEYKEDMKRPKAFDVNTYKF
ncbi:MAG: calcineurin-like phosphoesterase family protein [Bacteroidales bacterium]|nr:calcineurin-like phosphoesterase family protein [Bacteroidales bacterium]